ncbi:MAG: sugar phosphate isomerase/epimerase [Clostridiales bacterium]|nr:sugar phosphate isomerase/epimerase [Clostridiales bacterium]
MIRLGICTDVTNINEIAEIGFDYLEFNLAKLYAMTEEEFASVCALVDAAPIKVEACNCMLPGDIKVVGENVNAQAIHDYLDKAFARARRLGVKVVVFGSGNSRRVPDGFDTAVAWRQIGNYLRLVERHAMENDITVVIEPLRAGECNIMNFVSEATLMASLIQMPHIAVLADTYHMALGSEPLSALTMAGGLLKHVHIANAIGRKFPKEGDGERYADIFETLKEMGYEGRVSVEAGCDDFSRDAREAFKVLSALRA